jgi:hypothetical protein
MYSYCCVFFVSLCILIVIYIFRSGYSVSLCRSVNCLCVNVYCTVLYCLCVNVYCTVLYCLCVNVYCTVLYCTVCV